MRAGSDGRDTVQAGRSGPQRQIVESVHRETVQGGLLPEGRPCAGMAARLIFLFCFFVCLLLI